MVGTTGDNGFAETALKLLYQAGMDLSLVRTEDTATSTAVILVNASGKNMIRSFRARTNGWISISRRPHWTVCREVIS